MRSSSLIKTVKDEMKYESLIKSEQAKLKREEIQEFANETRENTNEKTKKIIEKQIEMQRQLLLRKLQNEVHDINLTEFNKMKQAALQQQKEDMI